MDGNIIGFNFLWNIWLKFFLTIKTKYILTKKVIKPHIPINYISSWAQYSILCDNKSMRDMIIKSLSNNKIPSMIYYRIPLHLQKVFKYLKYNINDFPISEDISNNIFSLPMHPYLNKIDQNRIIETLNSIIK